MNNFFMNLGIASPFLIIALNVILVICGCIAFGWAIVSIIKEGVKSGIQEAINEEKYRIGQLDDAVTNLTKTIKNIDKKIDNISINSDSAIFQLVRIKDNLDEMKYDRKD